MAEGGHNVPSEDVRRRFVRGIYNFFNLYMPMVNSWMLFDNSKARPTLIAKKKNGHVEAINSDLFEMIKKGVKEI